jgi:small-conductance mechanosensitive channel
VLAHPAPDALFTGFGASALQFQLRFWTEDALWLQVKSDIAIGVQQALRSARIGIPVIPVEVQVEAPAVRAEELR